jgi:hypothetical protein
MKLLTDHRATRWFLVFAGIAVTLLLTASYLPGPWHDDGGDRPCAVCHVNQQAVFWTLVALILTRLVPSLSPLLARMPSIEPQLSAKYGHTRAPPTS